MAVLRLMFSQPQLYLGSHPGYDNAQLPALMKDHYKRELGDSFKRSITHLRNTRPEIFTIYAPRGDDEPSQVFPLGNFHSPVGCGIFAPDSRQLVRSVASSFDICCDSDASQPGHWCFSIDIASLQIPKWFQLFCVVRL
jgi:hypothetical protein